MASSNQTHKIAKGETLDGIAKKYRVDPKAVWKLADNKAVVSKRGKPEALQPGDLIVIPPGEKELKEAGQKAEQMRKMRDAAAKLREALDREEARIEKRIKVYDTLIADNRASTLAIANELKKSLADTKRWGDGVDAAAQVAQIMASVTSICAKGLKSTKLSGAALEKLNEELAKDAMSMPYDALKDLGIKQAGQLKERVGEALGYVGVLAESWDKMTSPSFWANTYVQVTQNQKSWSEAVSMDVGEDIVERIKATVADGQKQIQKLQEQQAAVRTQQAENRKLVAECDARIRWAEQEATKLQ